MIFSEAMKALEDGKRVRCKCWPHDAYWSFRSDTKLYLSLVELFDVSRRVWELAEEPERMMFFDEVIKGLRAGKKFRRKGHEDKKSYIQDQTGKILVYPGGYAWMCTTDDFQAGDWVEVL